MSDDLSIPDFLAVAFRQRLVLDTTRSRLRAEIDQYETVGEVRAAVRGVLLWLDAECAHMEKQTAIAAKAVPLVDIPAHPNVARFNSNSSRRTD